MRPHFNNSYKYAILIIVNPVVTQATPSSGKYPLAYYLEVPPPPPGKPIRYSVNSNGTELEQVAHTHRASRRSGWPGGFGELNPSPHSRIFPSQRSWSQWVDSPFLLGSYSNDDGDGNEDVKKAIDLLHKTTTLFCTFLYSPRTTTT